MEADYKKARAYGLLQLVDGEQRIGSEMERGPVHKMGRVGGRNGCSHRCCIQRHVVRPQGLDQ
jgi:hypothetical protein